MRSREHGLYDAEMRAERAHFQELIREHLEILALMEAERGHAGRLSDMSHQGNDRLTPASDGDQS